MFDLFLPGLRHAVSQRHLPNPVFIERDFPTGWYRFRNSARGIDAYLDPDPFVTANNYAGLTEAAIKALVFVSPHSIWPRMGGK